MRECATPEMTLSLEVPVNGSASVQQLMWPVHLWSPLNRLKAHVP